jgi:hypothetical protein
MVNVTVIFVLSVTSYLVATLFHLDHATMAGRLGICAMFLFTAIGHFFKTDSMIPMLPPFVPSRWALIYASGIVEALFAVAVLALRNTCMDGGHSMGPAPMASE